MNHAQAIATQSGAKAAARVEAQRARILDAARRCFSERGFQGASIAAIADAAQMSQGLIYRYFTNKAAIIRAITDQQSETRRIALADIRSSADLVDQVLDKVDAWRDGRDDERGFDPALFLEVTAESTRDADVAAVVLAQETLIWEDFADFIRRNARPGTPPMDEATVNRRTIVFRCLLDGLILCYMRDRRMDRAVLRQSMLDALDAMAF